MSCTTKRMVSAIYEVTDLKWLRVTPPIIPISSDLVATKHTAFNPTPQPSDFLRGTLPGEQFLYPPLVKKRCPNAKGENNFKKGSLGSLVLSRIESQLQPRKIFIPSRMRITMIGYKDGSQVSVETFRMGRLGIIRGSGDVLDTKVKSELFELQRDKTLGVIRHNGLRD
jgi:hypothetical protein